MRRKEDGVIIIEGRQVGSTKQCCHCGAHFISQKGSGKTRGWCMKCNAITCGEMKCCECVPFEKRLDMAEKGLIVL
jgi:hypothetical protein